MKAVMEPRGTFRPELDIEDARRRLEAAAEEAERLELENAGFRVFEAWERYELIKNAIEAEERRRRLHERRAGR